MGTNIKRFFIILLIIIFGKGNEKGIITLTASQERFGSTHSSDGGGRGREREGGKIDERGE